MLLNVINKKYRQLPLRDVECLSRSQDVSYKLLGFITCMMMYLVFLSQVIKGLLS